MTLRQTQGGRVCGGAIAAELDHAGLDHPGLDHTTAARVLRIVRTEAGFGAVLNMNAVTIDSRLAQDLGIDSMTQVIIAAEIEDAFGIAISDDALAAAVTVSDLVGLVAVRLMSAGR